MNWAHGRQAADEGAPNRVPEARIPVVGFTEELNGAEQRELARFFTAIRKDKRSDREEACRAIIKRVLRDLSENRIDSRVHL
jgi:hypothetical protein